MNRHSDDRSLSEVHESVDPASRRKGWRRIAAFFGPAYLVSVGYMDPGNWATDLAGGSQYGYKLIWVLLMSNIMALLLQSLSARLGIVRGRDLAQCNRELYPKGVNFVLYILAELAIAATDLAEVLGMAIGLNLLLGIPLIWGVAITLLDTILLLYLQRLGMRKMEAFIIALVSIIGLCFLIEIFYAKPDPAALAGGFIPSIPDKNALYIALGIIGATVMPHNLYLHSALVQTRKIARDPASIWRAIKFNTIDSAIALNMAFFVNAAILILAAAAFYTTGNQHVAGLHDAHRLLDDVLGSKYASHLFAIALIAAGQSSTITGTLAGQIVMEGYLRLRINPWMRRLMTRLLAIVPAVLVILIAGESKVDEMLIFSQVLLSLQLGFAVIPLIHFVSDKKRMGEFALKPFWKTASWVIAALILTFNMTHLTEVSLSWMEAAGNPIVQGLIALAAIAFALLLAYTLLYPLRLRRRKELRPISVHEPFKAEATVPEPGASFRRLALAVDFSEKDQQVLRYARQLGAPGAHILLIHVVESASTRLMGSETEDYETQEDRSRLQAYVQLLQDAGFEVEARLGFRNRVREIARLVQEQPTDLLIVGSHGHKALGDLIFGETIDSLRHKLQVPIFIAR